VGGSTGTNLWGVLSLLGEVKGGGSIVTLLCDGGERYAHTYYDDAWLAAAGLDLTPYAETLARFDATGVWAPPG
jgi:cysteine synthase A